MIIYIQHRNNGLVKKITESEWNVFKATETGKSFKIIRREATAKENKKFSKKDFPEIELEEAPKTETE